MISTLKWVIYGFLALSLAPGAANAQEAVQSKPSSYIWVAGLNIVSGEKITFTEAMNLRISGRTVASEDAVVLKTAIHSALLAQFPPGQSPELHLGRQIYPIFRQESENWDFKAERPVDPGKPVGMVEYIYFLIPSAQMDEIPEGARALLKVNAPPNESGTEGFGIEVGVLHDAASTALGILPGTAAFTRDMVVNQ